MDDNLKILMEDYEKDYWEGEIQKKGTEQCAHEYLSCIDENASESCLNYFLEIANPSTFRKWFVEKVFSVGGIKAGGKMIEEFYTKENSSIYILNTLPWLDLNHGEINLFVNKLLSTPVVEYRGGIRFLFRGDYLSDRQRLRCFNWILNGSSTGEFLLDLIKPEITRKNLPSPPFFQEETQDILDAFDSERAVERLLDICKDPRKLVEVIKIKRRRDKMTVEQYRGFIEKIIEFDNHGLSLSEIVCENLCLSLELYAEASAKLIEIDQRGEFIFQVLTSGNEFLQGPIWEMGFDKLLHIFKLHGDDLRLMEVWHSNYPSTEQRIKIYRTLVEINCGKSAFLKPLLAVEPFVSNGVSYVTEKEKANIFHEVIWRDNKWLRNKRYWTEIIIDNFYKNPYFNIITVLDSYNTATKKTMELNLSDRNRAKIIEMIRDGFKNSNNMNKDTAVVKEFITKCPSLFLTNEMLI